MKDQNHYLLRLLHSRNTNDITHLFLSCYGSRTSVKIIARDNGFYDLLERDDEVMVDRAYQIQDDLLLHFFILVVSPDARVKSQMIKSEVKKTKEVANFRIHVERALNRIKFFRIFKKPF